MRKWLLPLVLSSSGFLMAHPKDGFFVEGGLMTGLLETQEDIEKKPPCPLGVICDSTYMLNAAPTFTQAALDNRKNPVTFNTTHPVKMQLSDGQLHIESFLPYNLHNVNVYMTTANGQKVKVGMFKDIPQFTQSVIAQSLLPEIAKAGGNANSTFSLEPSASSDPTTTQVLNDLNKITVDIKGEIAQAGAAGNTTWAIPTPAQAKELVETFLNLTAMLSSPEFKNAVLNAPFDLVNGPSDFKPNVVPNAQGQCGSNTACTHDILNKQQVYDRYTGQKIIVIDTLTSKAPYEGLGGPGVWGVQPYIINPKDAKILDTNSLNSDTWPIITIMHEFGHVNDYGHNGNMTYQNGWYNSIGGPESTDGPHAGWKYYKINGQYVQAGMGGIGVDVWTQLGKAGDLPINYNNLASQSSPVYPTAFMRALRSVLSTNSAAASAMVGFNVMGGYQQYFNDYFGLSYYGIIKYNYAKRMGFVHTINQVAFGVGMDALIDFKTNYSTYRIRNKRGVGIVHRKFKSSYGMFVGFRALWKGYGLKGAGFFNSGNLNLDVGFNYRYKHSKYSIGVALPLAQQNLVAKINTNDLAGTLTIKEGVRHFNVFFNYGWVF
ncbi:Outer membrane protein HomA [Helicobacter sp. NHP19-003]|uniref:Outer membrane protein HomA n=1 Tax=Helicobacter gastrocanis TaxID=2849641 RepID=A0ABN6I101_9HELI|nr:outer membrane protein [Helicobacter sp. NHP19-003]BCZ17271.1 Outer membrane protein HomA [Helicobacter sp. NHP19-003]